MRFEARKRFDEFIRPEFYKRVDNSHPLDLFIGLNSKAEKTIMLKGEINVMKNIRGTSCVEIKHLKNGTDVSVLFSLVNQDVESLFFKICDDFVEQTREIRDPNKGYEVLMNRFMLWKKLFVPKKGMLSENEIIGLIGELIYLNEEAFKKYSVHDALLGWTGTEPTIKDFTYGNCWYEIKTKQAQSQTIRISSLEQLDGSIEGELIVIDLEKMSIEYKGLKLNELILLTKSKLTCVEDSDIFDIKLSQIGYEYNEDYDNYSYAFKKMTKYQVTNTFPRLLRNTIDDRIVRVCYEISINSIANFIIEEKNGFTTRF